MNESNYYFRDGQYFFASTSSKVSPYEMILMLNTISELDDESLTYNGQNISTSTPLQVPFYKTILTLNTVAELDDKSLTYDSQNSSSSTLPQVPVIILAFHFILLVLLLELGTGFIFHM
ncbi:hypothetical protein F8M41_001945 [Gigaspora margarita]|uniref:Uncharacterized protein n=1 Tax=Gigaspora margarita TaxID=4874 RepID=A0A8H4A7P9_GIGMA|nr:hypothetical protein F8M41_001945 [Gigaspora margarita]